MSGTAFAGKPREMFWDLLVTEEQRAERARALRALYVLADPRGWDARRMGADSVATLTAAFAPPSGRR
jgi:hypothetical protein